MIQNEKTPEADEYETDPESAKTPKTVDTVVAAKAVKTVDAVVGDAVEAVKPAEADDAKSANSDKKKRRAPRKSKVHTGNESNATVCRLLDELRAGPRSKEKWLKEKNELLEQPAGATDVLGVKIDFQMDGKKLEKVVIGFLGRTVEVEPTTFVKDDGTSEHGFSIATLGTEVGKIIGVEMPSLLEFCEFKNVGADPNLFNGKSTKRVAHLVERLRCFKCGEIEQKKGDLRSSSVTLFGHTVSLCADCARCGVVLDVCGNKFTCKAECRGVRVHREHGNAVLVDGNWTNSEEEAAAGESDSEDDKPLVPLPAKKAAPGKKAAKQAKPEKPEKPDTPKKEKSPTIVIDDDSEDEASAPVAMVVDDASSTASALSAVSESSVASSAAAAFSPVAQVQEASETAEAAKSARKRKQPEEETVEAVGTGLMEEGSSAASAAPAKKEKKEKQEKKEKNEKKEKGGSSAASRPDPVCAAQERVYMVTESQLKACYEELGDFIPRNHFAKMEEILKMRLFQTPVKKL